MAQNDQIDQRISALDLRPRAATQDTILGKARRLNDLEGIEIAFLVISVIGLAACFILTLIKVVGYKGDDFTFAILIIANMVVCCYYIFDGIFRERPYELAIFVIATVIVVVYVIVNFAETSGWTDTVKLIRFVCALLLAPFLIIVGCIITKNYNESGNLIFRTVGANAELQSICKTMFFTSSILKLDFQLEMSMVVLVLRDGRKLELLEKIVLGVGIPLTIIWLILGFLAMKYENKIATWFFWVTSWMEPAYIVYKIYETTKDGTASHPLTAVIYTCASLALVIRLVLLVLMVFVYRNYSKGLKQKLSGTPMKRHATHTTTADNEDSNQF